MHKSQLQIRFRERMTFQESLLLGLLWCIVFGPHKPVAESYNRVGSTVRYIGNTSDIEQMHAVITNRDWNQVAYLPHIESCDFIPSLTPQSTFSFGLHRLFDKIVEISVLPL